MLVAGEAQKYGLYVSGSNTTIINLSLVGFEVSMVLGNAENITQRNVGALLQAVMAQLLWLLT